MNYNGVFGYRFKPLVNESLANLEITDINELKIGEPYLIEYKLGRFCKPTLKMKGTLIKLFNARTMTHMICRNKLGKIFSAPIEESRVYKSPDSVYGNILREKALVHCINTIYHQTNDDNYKDYKVENTIGYHLGSGWILSDKQN